MLSIDEMKYQNDWWMHKENWYAFMDDWIGMMWEIGINEKDKRNNVINELEED